jgi:hypothetical protein
MAITKLDAVLEAIEQGKTNGEIRDEIDGRLSDKRLDKLRQHPNVGGGDDMKRDVEIEREVEKIFAPKPTMNVPDGSKIDHYVGAVSAEESTVPVLMGTNNAVGARLVMVGMDVEGLLKYHVDDRGVTIEADLIEIDGDLEADLIAEIREAFKIHKEMM